MLLPCILVILVINVNRPLGTLNIFFLCRYVIECPNCSVIYRSRQYWYGNQDPVDTVVRTEIQHVWPGVSKINCFYLTVLPFKYLALLTFMFVSQSDKFLKDNNNAAQRLLDGVNYMAQSVSELSVKPAKAVTAWLTDQIAPAYWKPNSLILVSFKASFFCKVLFPMNRRSLY